MDLQKSIQITQDLKSNLWVNIKATLLDYPETPSISMWV